MASLSSRSFRASHQQHMKKWGLLTMGRNRSNGGRRLKVLLAGGLVWACAFILLWLYILWICGALKHSASNVCKKNKLYIFFEALGLIPKAVHRCPIPLFKDPNSIKIPDLPVPTIPYHMNLTYTTEDPLVARNDKIVPLFGGYQTWQQREESFRPKPQMQVHCGFVGKSGGDILKEDRKFVRKCRFVVASGIFDGYDSPHQPSNVSNRSKDLFCFLMVVDEKSLRSIRGLYNLTEETKAGLWIGLWRLVLFKNSPYDEPRRNGKVPKLLMHRLFPEAEYSIWIDGKMELLVDPLLILERYLWRTGHDFAIARHKHHRSIFEEADANKRRKRYARPLIDKQVNIYLQEGMKPWTTKNHPLPSDVPEGAIIIRRHTPQTNWFSCLWFNEVNRFTPRDQLSFGYVVYRLNGSFPFFMFPNCEYNSLFLLHKHTREHSSKIEWVKSLDELKDNSSLIESRGGIGLFTSYLEDPFPNSTFTAE